MSRAAQKPERRIPTVEEIRTGPPMLEIPPVAAVVGISSRRGSGRPRRARRRDDKP